jgi:hypothetical protein
MGGFWIGGLGRVIIGPLPVSLSVVATWAFVFVIVGAVLGFLFPKVMSCLLFPFAIFGIAD